MAFQQFTGINTVMYCNRTHHVHVDTAKQVADEEARQVSQVSRLLLHRRQPLPNLDRERGSYALKESVLASSLIDALGLSRDSHDALCLINWRKCGAKTGANAGNFALVAAEVL